jgi:hypothetical protein
MCVNIDCETSLINRNFLKQKIINYATYVRQCAKSFKIRNIDDVVVIITIYIFFIFRIFDVTIDDKNVIAIFIRRIYIMKELKTKILLNNDIFDSKQFNINVKKQIVTIKNYNNVKIQFNVINTKSQIKCVIRVNEIIKISIKSITIISFKLRDKNNLFIEHDFMFTFARIDRLNQNENVLFHIIDAHIEMIQIHNINFENVYIFKNTRFEFVQKYEKKSCYLINAKYAHLTINAHKSVSQN